MYQRIDLRSIDLPISAELRVCVCVCVVEHTDESLYLRGFDVISGPAEVNAAKQ